MHNIEEYLEERTWSEGYYASYDSIVESFGYNILMGEAIGDYQGDMVYVLYDGLFDQWGVFITGYGSCSGCDILEAMEMDNAPVEEYRELQEEWHNGVDWYNTPEELYDAIREKEGDWYWYEDGYSEFIEKFKEVYVDGTND
jgi:hypothetical protein